MQNAIHLLKHLHALPAPVAGEPSIFGVVLQAPVSDREYAHTLPLTADLLSEATALVCSQLTCHYPVILSSKSLFDY